MPLLNALTKCQIVPDDTSGPLTCHFNPKQLVVSTSASWKAQPNPNAQTAPAAQFLGTNARTIQMELLFDTSWLGLAEFLLGMDDKVAKDVNKLLSWTNPTDLSRTSNQPNPPKLTVFWGDHTLVMFTVYLKTVTATYTEFSPGGQPTRANVNCTFEEIPQPASGQNPTSGSLPGRRTHLVTAGDSLHSIAQREYGKPALWRGLANINGIDDPLRVPLGTTVLIPPREDAENNA